MLRTFSHDYKVIVVGDASMSPYEIVAQGGSVEHWNEETGQAWLQRLLHVYPKTVWLNPVRRDWWGHTQSVGMVYGLMDGRMFPMTLEGLENAMRELAR